MQIAALLYRLSITFWTGGIPLFTFILTPALFKSLSRDHAGQIVGILFPGYFRWGLTCGVIALGARLAMRTGAPGPVILLVIMLALTSVQAFYIEPKAAALKRQIPSFETTPREHPLRREFSKLHAFSASCNLAVMAGGVALVVML